MSVFVQKKNLPEENQTYRYTTVGLALCNDICFFAFFLDWNYFITAAYTICFRVMWEPPLIAFLQLCLGFVEILVCG